ncbi:hypothetical protein [Mucisphaera sp.]|uniref:hypothetical protein n=1 Tax=Mucisphaera sp. TaxID=2913024 RepID=UPI003D145BCB
MCLGILVLATRFDWHKAIALSLSLRTTSKELPLACVAAPDVICKLEGYYETLIPERCDIKGFEHKLYLDEYSPFQNTLFLDADMLSFKDVRQITESWRGCAYMARGRVLSGGISAFGLDRIAQLERIGVSHFSEIGGAGHAYFEKPGCFKVFHRAREIGNNYHEIAPGASLADEDVLGITMTEQGILPARDKQVVGFLGGVNRSTLSLDVLKPRCTYIDQENDVIEPALLHFPRRMTPLLYHSLMKEICDHHRAPINIPWRRLAIQEWFQHSLLFDVKQRLKAFRFKEITCPIVENK